MNRIRTKEIQILRADFYNRNRLLAVLQAPEAGGIFKRVP